MHFVSNWFMKPRAYFPRVISSDAVLRLVTSRWAVHTTQGHSTFVTSGFLLHRFLNDFGVGERPLQFSY